MSRSTVTEEQLVQGIAEDYKKQYQRQGKWKTYDGWEKQPEVHYLILCELKSFSAVEALLNDTWTRKAKRKLRASRKAA